MVGVVGLEPTTNWLRVNCATNCATHPYLFNFHPLRWLVNCYLSKNPQWFGFFSAGSTAPRTHTYLIFTRYVASVNCYLSKNPQWFGFFSAESIAPRTHTYLIFKPWSAVGYLANGSSHIRSNSPTPSSDLTFSQLLSGVLRTNTYLIIKIIALYKSSNKSILTQNFLFSNI